MRVPIYQQINVWTPCQPLLIFITAFKRNSLISPFLCQHLKMRQQYIGVVSELFIIETGKKQFKGYILLQTVFINCIKST